MVSGSFSYHATRMRSGLITSGGLVLALGIGGCAGEVHLTGASEAALDDLSALGLVHGVLVRGSPSALRQLPLPLQQKEGRNRTFEPCRSELEAAASRLGALGFEAVSAGAERLVDGAYEGLIEVRIIYGGTLAYQVRHALLTCKTDARGRVVAVD